MIYTTRSEEETKKIAQEFGNNLHGGELIFLYGDLGAGKTTFVRGVAESMGFDQPVRSPSFTIVNRYPIEHKTIKKILHVDLYRIDDPAEIETLALEEEVGKLDTITFIEWPEKGDDYLPKPTYECLFKMNENAHIIEIKKTAE